MKTKKAISINSIINILTFTLLTSIVIAAITLFLWIKEGAHINTLSLFDYKIDKLYIKWDKKLIIDIKNIEKTAPKKSDIDIKIPNLYYILRVLYNTTHRINIAHFDIDAFEGSVHYEDKKIAIKTNLFDISSVYSITAKRLFSKEFILDIHPYDVHFIGNASIQSQTNTIKLDTLFNYGTALYGGVALEFKDNHVYLKAQSEPIQDLKALEEKLAISPVINEWIFNRLTASSLTLNSIKSHFNINNFSDFLKNLEVQAQYENLSYIFDTRLDPLEATKTRLRIKNQTAHLYFDSPTYYELPISSIKVSIDNLALKKQNVQTKNPTLHIDVNYDNLLTPKLFDILDVYGFKLPLEQTAGETKLRVNFHKNLITKVKNYSAKVNLKNSRVYYNSVPLSIDEARLDVKDKHIDVHTLRLRKPYAYDAKVTGSLNLQTKTGRLTTQLEHINFYGITSKEPFELNTTITPEGINFNSAATKLIAYNNLEFNISSGSLFLDNNQTLHLETLKLFSQEKLNATLFGLINIKTLENDINILVETLNIALKNGKTITLNKPASLKTKQSIRSLQSSNTLDLTVMNYPISLENFAVDFKEDLQLTIDTARLDKRFKSSIDIKYDYTTQVVSGMLYNMNAPTLEYIDVNTTALDFYATYIDDALLFHLPDLETTYEYKQKNHMLKVTNSARLATIVPRLRNYTDIHAFITAQSDDLNSINFIGNTKTLPIKGYVKHDSNNSHTFSGTYKDNLLNLSLNSDINLSYEKNDLRINAYNNTFNIEKFLDKNRSSTTKIDTNYPDIDINAQSGTLFIKGDNRLNYDAIKASYIDEAFYATLNKDKGKAIIFYDKKNIQLFGEEFSDKLFQDALGFKGLFGGSYNFYLKGDMNNFTGGLIFSNATAKGFSTYNNILAIINSIPALINFKSPGFSRDGYNINKGEILFQRDANIVRFETIKLYGKSTNIFGSGFIDLDKNSIDMNLRVILLKDVGEILNLPVARQARDIVFGEDGSLATTLSVTGNLSNPTVKVDLTKDIIMAPVNIIKRTVDMPVQFIKWLSGSKEK